MTRRLRNALLPLLGLLALAAGCGRMNTLSEVKADGTLVRTLTFKGADPDAKPAASPNGPDGPGGGADGMMSLMGGGPGGIPVEAIAVIPKGEGWM
jgi:hypothetical protein